MPYAIILPLLLLFEAALLLMALLTCFFKKLRWFSVYMLGIAFGSSLGWLIANEILFHSSKVPFYPAKKYSFWDMNNMIGDDLISAANILQWPYAASGLGIVIGSLIGFYFVYRRHEKKRS